MILLINLPAIAFDKEEQNIISIYERINPAIVCVDSQAPDGISCGTGCIIHKSGIILTSAHVLGNSDSVIVTIFNGQDYIAKIIKTFNIIPQKHFAKITVNGLTGVYFNIEAFVPSLEILVPEIKVIAFKKNEPAVT